MAYGPDRLAMKYRSAIARILSNHRCDQKIAMQMSIMRRGTSTRATCRLWPAEAKRRSVRHHFTTLNGRPERRTACSRKFARIQGAVASASDISQGQSAR